jgi:DivIVA domain
MDLKGYNATEVDYFLDLVLNDYEMFSEVLNQLKSKNQELLVSNQQLKEKVIQLEKEKMIQENNLRSLGESASGNIDILKRLSALEKAVFTRR